MDRNEFEEFHRYCPNCGSEDVEVTTIGIMELDGEYDDDRNKARCGCGWFGMRYELREKPQGQ